MNAHAFFIAPTGHTILEESICDKKKADYCSTWNVVKDIFNIHACAVLRYLLAPTSLFKGPIRAWYNSSMTNVASIDRMSA